MILEIHSTDFNGERTRDSTEIQASIHDRNVTARRFDTIHDILQSLRNAPILHIGNIGLKVGTQKTYENKRQSGTM